MELIVSYLLVIITTHNVYYVKLQIEPDKSLVRPQSPNGVSSRDRHNELLFEPTECPSTERPAIASHIEAPTDAPRRR